MSLTQAASFRARFNWENRFEASVSTEVVRQSEPAESSHSRSAHILGNYAAILKIWRYNFSHNPRARHSFFEGAPRTPFAFVARFFIARLRPGTPYALLLAALRGSTCAHHT